MYSKNFAHIFILFFSIVSPLSLGAERVVADKQYEAYVNEMASSFAERMQKEFNLSWIKWGGQFRDYIDQGMEFKAQRRATLEEARSIALAVMNQFVETIHSHQKIQSYLEKLSLTRFSISIDFVDSNERSHFDGSIDSVSVLWDRSDVQKRHLSYASTDAFSEDYSFSEDEVFYEKRFKESLENASKLNAASSIINPAIHNSAAFEEELDQILSSFNKDMDMKHGLSFESIGWMTPWKSTPHISEIRTKCVYFHPVTLEEARKLMLIASNNLLNRLNDSTTLRPYLKEYPFPASRLKLRMLFRRQKAFVGKVPYDNGSMESAVLNANDIKYYEGRGDRVVHAKESYQEAQNHLANAPPPTAWQVVTKAMRDFGRWVGSLIETAWILFVLCFFFILEGVFPL